jgi:hypothetical protein
MRRWAKGAGFAMRRAKERLRVLARHWREAAGQEEGSSFGESGDRMAYAVRSVIAASQGYLQCAGVYPFTNWALSSLK